MRAPAVSTILVSLIPGLRDPNAVRIRRGGGVSHSRNHYVIENTGGDAGRVLATVVQRRAPGGTRVQGQLVSAGSGNGERVRPQPRAVSPRRCLVGMRGNCWVPADVSSTPGADR